MRPKFIVLITVMSILITLLSSLPKFSAHRQPISQTGDMAATATLAPIRTSVPTVIARPVRSAYPVSHPVINVRSAGYGDVATAPRTVFPSAPALDSFATALYNGNADQVVGVYVADALAMPVLQQPNGNANYVSTDDDVVTQFAAANRFHTIGLLAHNYLAGMHFSALQVAQQVTVIYGNGTMKYYRVNKVERYQALSPTSPQSDFIDLNDGKNTRLSAGDVFQRIYTQGDSVVFQTCIQKNGDPSWGRLFITATPASGPTSFASPARSRLFDRWF